MRLSKTLQACLRFERFCNEHDVHPADLAELITLARRAFHAGEQACNTGNHRAEDRTADRFRSKALAMGFGVQWPGLWPVLREDGRDVELPCID
jgi:hypothetical protein